MLFGWNVEQGITSNSVIYVKDGVTVGIGTGEQDRVGVAEIAIFKAYTKYADALCFRKYGVPYKQYELEAGQGKRDKGALAGDRCPDQEGQRRAHRVRHGIGRVLPLPGRCGRGDQRGDHGDRPARAARTGTTSRSLPATRRTPRSPWSTPASGSSNTDDGSVSVGIGSGGCGHLTDNLLTASFAWDAMSSNA